ncbi:pilus assembly PilX N-terminal domain-containing protein [Microbacterium sp. CPCC 204701]|uniref:pilus assembly PilX N-terminal domain-containing protein n=1 Tax=Microbacterium sp. CPCC 204701 TaxID=2493084 RepID=UPI000FD79293|nr:pilus assembly PilX N-terminal domain-containing protein [Microbacterium sp. CPCC 204701]
MLVNLGSQLRQRRDERGSALISVLVIMLVLSLGALTLAAIVTNSTGVVVEGRSTAQSRAAADAGIAELLAAAERGGVCDQILSDVELGAGSSYTATSTCDETTGLVVFDSNGTSGHGDTTRVRAVYELNITPAGTPPTSGGPGLFYTYGMNTRLNSYVYDDANSEVGIDEFTGSAGVYASTGKIECGSDSVFPGDIYTKTGDLQLDDGCLVEGNAYIGGRAFVNGGTIEGSLIAPKNDNHTISGTVGVSDGSDGNVLLGGTFTLNGGTVHGSVSAAGTGNNTLGSGTIFGNFTYRGSYSTWGTPANVIVKGARVKNTELTAPTLPQIPPWQDVTFTPLNATTAPQSWSDEGYQLTTVTGTACSKWSGNSADVTSVAGSLSTRMIFDIRACAGNFDTNAGGANKEVKVNQDIAIITNRWFLSGTRFKSADGQPHTIFLITPDSQPTVAGPQCNSPAQDSQQLNDSTVAPEIAVYVYTPCLMKFNSGTATFKGQVYSGRLEFGGGVKVAFAPRNIPGYDFGKDVEPWPGTGGGGTSSGIGGLLWLRDVP